MRTSPSGRVFATTYPSTSGVADFNAFARPSGCAGAGSHSPWQNPFAERLIGSIRRACLNHVVVLGEQHLRRTLARYFAYYHGARTHLSLEKDAPHGRPIEQPELGRVIPISEVGGLHHRYV